ncbi:MAG: hypothetical protein JWO06_3316, partial [Bacteroidota bacterium]|nr:hypothetical protein [Bacteroidota bacterium]
MKKALLLAFGIVFCALVTEGQQGAVVTGHRPDGLRFTENKGQWDQKVLYRAEVPHGNVLLEKNDFYFFLYSPTDLAQIHHPGGHGNVTVHGHAFKEEFVGANTNPVMNGELAYSDYANYYHGNNPAHWASGARIYQKVHYQELYDGIDLLVYNRANEQMKYDLVVKPGADASKIKIHYNGVSKVKIDNEALQISTSVGDIIEQKPYAYQDVNGERKEVKCNFALSHGQVCFQFPDGYDNAYALVIDPTIVFASYTGATADNWGYSATYDKQGSLFLGGYVNATPPFGTTYPTTTGAFQITWAGGTGGANGGNGSGIGYACDMGITKFTPDGSTLVYSTYLGGSDNETPNSLVVDAQDNLIVYGVTYSSDYPTTSGAFATSYTGAGDIVVTKFNSAGTALIGSTYVGGSGSDGINYDAQEFTSGNLKRNYGDQNRGEVNVDDAGNIFVVSCTVSTDFPVTNGCFQNTSGGGQDGIVF